MKQLIPLCLSALCIGCQCNRGIVAQNTQQDNSLPAVENIDSKWDSLMKIADSVSLITGIAWGPYYYDPSWTIDYSDGQDTLFYYPRDDESTQFSIPSTVKVIDERAFQCNKHLESIIIPQNVEEIGLASFTYCMKLRSVTIEGPITFLAWRSFDSCPELTKIDLPATLNSISGYAFAFCRNLRTVIVRNPIPPTLEFIDDDDGTDYIDPEWTFSGVEVDKCTLYVPAGSISAYKSKKGWNQFGTISILD